MVRTQPSATRRMGLEVRVWMGGLVYITSFAICMNYTRHTFSALSFLCSALVSLCSAMAMLCCVRHFRFRFPLAGYLVCSPARHNAQRLPLRTVRALPPCHHAPLVIVILLYFACTFCCRCDLDCRIQPPNSTRPTEQLEPPLPRQPIRHVFDKATRMHAT